jgi:hypothetical protein
MSSIVRAKWTEQILDEVFRNIVADRTDLDVTRLGRTRELMNRAVRDVLVDGFQPLIDALTLPDADDRHVLAAAIRCGAQAIVTHNLRDFPANALKVYGLEAVHPDAFVLDLLDLSSGIVLRVLHDQAASLKSPPMTLDELLVVLERNGLVRSVAEVRRHLASP